MSSVRPAYSVQPIGRVRDAGGAAESISSYLSALPTICMHPELLGLTADIREFKKLRRQLQRKRYIKIELCVKLSLLRLFYVDHVVQNRRTALSLAWQEWFSSKGKE